MKIQLADEVELISAVIYDGKRKIPVRLLHIPDDHVLVELEDSTMTMGDVLSIGVPAGTPTGSAYVVLRPGDRDPH